MTYKVKITSYVLACMILLAWGGTASAVPNPFKKAKNHKFLDSIAWYFNDGAAVKSGKVKDGSDQLFYHLNINSKRLRLRLGKNDPSGELEDTRSLATLAIIDVKADGKRLSRFQQCLDNQESRSGKLKQNAVVINDVCVNGGGGGDFIINLDKQTKRLIKQASKLEFVIEPYGRPIRLVYSMKGFSSVMAKVDKPKPVKKAKKAPPKKKVVVAKPKKPVIKNCVAKPPATFSGKVKARSYPCNDAGKKAAAMKAINSQVKKEKQRRATDEAAARKKLKAEDAAVAQGSSREKEWEMKQKTMWVKRCQKHWNKGVSPCFCVRYMDQAPPGVKNTCGQ